MVKRVFYHNKLFRDKVFEKRKSEGAIFNTRRRFLMLNLMSNFVSNCAKKLKKLLCQKHALSLLKNWQMFEVIDALSAAHTISREEIVEMQTKKHQERGGFSGRNFVETAEYEEDSHSARYCLAQPAKSPEIKK